jgi:hypothetical protein
MHGARATAKVQSNGTVSSALLDAFACTCQHRQQAYSTSASQNVNLPQPQSQPLPYSRPVQADFGNQIGSLGGGGYPLVAASPLLACAPLQNSVQGAVVLIQRGAGQQRGACAFLTGFLLHGCVNQGALAVWAGSLYLTACATRLPLRCSALQQLS